MLVRRMARKAFRRLRVRVKLGIYARRTAQIRLVRGHWGTGITSRGMCLVSVNGRGHIGGLTIISVWGLERAPPGVRSDPSVSMP